MVPIPDPGVTDFPEKRFLEKPEASTPLPKKPEESSSEEAAKASLGIPNSPGAAS